MRQWQKVGFSSFSPAAKFKIWQHLPPTHKHPARILYKCLHCQVNKNPPLQIQLLYSYQGSSSAPISGDRERGWWSISSVTSGSSSVLPRDPLTDFFRCRFPLMGSTKYFVSSLAKFCLKVIWLWDWFRISGPLSRLFATRRPSLSCTMRINRRRRLFGS